MKGTYLQNPNKVEKTVFENVSESVWLMKDLSGLESIWDQRCNHSLLYSFQASPNPPQMLPS